MEHISYQDPTWSESNKSAQLQLIQITFWEPEIKLFYKHCCLQIKSLVVKCKSVLCSYLFTVPNLEYLICNSNPRVIICKLLTSKLNPWVRVAINLMSTYISASFLKSKIEYLCKISRWELALEIVCAAVCAILAKVSDVLECVGCKQTVRAKGNAQLGAHHQGANRPPLQSFGPEPSHQQGFFWSSSGAKWWSEASEICNLCSCWQFWNCAQPHVWWGDWQARHGVEVKQCEDAWFWEACRCEDNDCLYEQQHLASMCPTCSVFLPSVQRYCPHRDVYQPGQWY